VFQDCVPVTLSTVGVETGADGPTRPAILTELPDITRNGGLGLFGIGVIDATAPKSSAI